ncbi:hypothetical protein, partial [Spongiibacter marinus]|uniref:hypothetical protein n=1 Tax=Spongiibacter marinus TaxID=354246 RepID=UPI0035BE2D09
PPVRKPAGPAKAGERPVPSDTVNTGNTGNTGNAPAADHSGNTPASGQPAPAPATDAPADVQDVTATSQKPAQGKSAETGRPAAAQPAAQQTADWGAPLGPGQTLSIRIYQLSALIGRGAGRSVTLTF